MRYGGRLPGDRRHEFYERAEIKDAVAYLTLLVNPADAVAFARVVNSPRRGHRADVAGAAARAREHDRRAGLGRGRDARGGPGPRRRRRVKALGRFMSTMERLRERVGGAAPVGELLEETARARPATSRRSRPSARSRPQGRLENLEELVGVAREFDANAVEGEPARVEEFLQQIALFADAGRRSRDDEGLVTLMTLHNAKGLEFPIVFMIGCEDGVFPHSRSIEEGDLEEERRLAYVGITARASASSTLTYARTPQLVRRRASWNMRVALPRRDPARADRPRRGTAPTGPRRPRRHVGGRRGRGRARPRRGSRRRFRARRRRRPRQLRRGRRHRQSSPAGWSSCASPATAPSAS